MKQIITTTIYKCDNCGKKLGKNKHLSITLARHSGWVKESLGAWRHFKEVGGIKQFCNGKCLGEYFEEILK